MLSGHGRRRACQSWGRAAKTEARKRWLSFQVQDNAPKITSIKVYQLDIPIVGGQFQCGKQKPVEVLDSTVVKITTNIGIEGWGEHCPLGSVYLPAYAKGTRAGIQEIGPALIGKNPSHLLEIDQTMDETLNGHPYVKAAIDIACWDILGKMAKLPLCSLLGGRFSENVPVYLSTSSGIHEHSLVEDLRRYKANGYRKFQCKRGGDPDEDVEMIKLAASELRKGDTLWADGNCAYSTRDALRLIQGLRDVDLKIPFFLEQPCKTYEENLFVRKRCPFPMVLDEYVDSIEAIMQIAHDKAADIVSIKPGKIGGLTRALQMRNLCIRQGIMMDVEDIWGSCIIIALAAHMAASTPPRFVNAAWDFGVSLERDSRVCHNSPRITNGCISAPTGHGLGVEPKMEFLGDPLFVIE